MSEETISLISRLEELPPLSPLHLFALEISLKTELHRLPSPPSLFGEKEIASCYGAWNPEGVRFRFDIDTPPAKEDRLDLWIDTRDLKTRHSPSRFCHHFLFLPVSRTKEEITRMRPDEFHPLADPSLLGLAVTIQKKGYSLLATIPSSCLVGFDPLNYPKIGFTYRLTLAAGGSQSFALTLKASVIEQHPSLWATCHLETST